MRKLRETRCSKYIFASLASVLYLSFRLVCKFDWLLWQVVLGMNDQGVNYRLVILCECMGLI